MIRRSSSGSGSGGAERPKKAFSWSLMLLGEPIRWIKLALRNA
jgi:hypothetical protein